MNIDIFNNLNTKYIFYQYSFFPIFAIISSVNSSLDKYIYSTKIKKRAHFSLFKIILLNNNNNYL